MKNDSKCGKTNEIMFLPTQTCEHNKFQMLLFDPSQYANDLHEN